MPFYEYDESHFFRADAAPDDVAAARRAGFMRLAALFAERFKQDGRAHRATSPAASPICSSPPAIACPSSSAATCGGTSRAGSFLESSAGVTVTDLDGNHLYDLTGSYGVNVFGYDFYKECIERGASGCAIWVRCWAPTIR